MSSATPPQETNAPTPAEPAPAATLAPAEKVKQFPTAPGVYLMKDEQGRVIYIGKAKLLRARLMSYFRENSRDPKAGRIIQRTETIVWETAPDEFGALNKALHRLERFWTDQILYRL